MGKGFVGQVSFPEEVTSDLKETWNYPGKEKGLRRDSQKSLPPRSTIEKRFENECLIGLPYRIFFLNFILKLALISFYWILRTLGAISICQSYVRIFLASSLTSCLP